MFVPFVVVALKQTCGELIEEDESGTRMLYRGNSILLIHFWKVNFERALLPTHFFLIWNSRTQESIEVSEFKRARLLQT